MTRADVVSQRPMIEFPAAFASPRLFFQVANEEQIAEMSEHAGDETQNPRLFLAYGVLSRRSRSVASMLALMSVVCSLLFCWFRTRTDLELEVIPCDIN